MAGSPGILVAAGKRIGAGVGPREPGMNWDWEAAAPAVAAGGETGRESETGGKKEKRGPVLPFHGRGYGVQGLTDGGSKSLVYGLGAWGQIVETGRVIVAVMW